MNTLHNNTLFHWLFCQSDEAIVSVWHCTLHSLQSCRMSCFPFIFWYRYSAKYVVWFVSIFSLSSWLTFEFLQLASSTQCIKQAQRIRAISCFTRPGCRNMGTEISCRRQSSLGLICVTFMTKESKILFQIT